MAGIATVPVFLLMLLSAPLAWAQEGPIPRGTVLKPVGEVVLRDAPPSGFLLKPGERLGVVDVNDTVRVIGSKTVKTLVGEYFYLQVEPVVDGDSRNSTGGWAYLGDSEGVRNFSLTESAPNPNME